MKMLLCPVRNCRLSLVREGKRAFCANGHSFDVARSGYLNLLQPQERRSKQPGDTTAAVAARRRLHDRGVTAPLLEGIADLLGGESADTVLDAGCGEGFYLGSLAQRFGFAGHGVDISTKAIDAAATRYPNCEWIVGNADRLLPYADNSFLVVMSITARMNPPEFRRVLQVGGHLLVAIASPQDLVELRGTGEDRVARTVEMFAKEFKVRATRRVTTAADLDTSGVDDVLHSIYRPLQSKSTVAMRVTFSLDLLLFQAL